MGTEKHRVKIRTKLEIMIFMKIYTIREEEIILNS